jgi:hypothetical protein
MKQSVEALREKLNVQNQFSVFVSFARCARLSAMMCAEWCHSVFTILEALNRNAGQLCDTCSILANSSCFVT